MIGAGAMDLIGVERERGRDVATGIVLGTALGLAALFLYLDTTKSATTGAAQQILFGSIFTVDPSTVPLVLVLSAARPRDRRRDQSPVVAEFPERGVDARAGHQSTWRGPALHGRDGRLGRSVVDHCWFDPLDGAVDRSGGDVGAGDEDPARVVARGRGAGGRRDLAGDPLRVRQLLLDPVQSRSAGQFLHRVAWCSSATSRPGLPFVRRRARQPRRTSSTPSTVGA